MTLNGDLVSAAKAALKIRASVGSVPASITLKRKITGRDVIRGIKAGRG